MTVPLGTTTPRRDRAVLAAAVAAVLLTSSLVVFTLLKAERDGTQALQRLQTSQVEQVARSMDARIKSIFPAFAGIVANKPIPWHATLRDPSDLARIKGLQDLSPKARTGYLILDRAGRVTNGTLLRDPGVIGTRLDRPELTDVLTSTDPKILPVAAGLTTALPTLAFAFPIADAADQRVGTLLLESDVSTQSDFYSEVTALKPGKTGTFSYLDDRGTVIVSSDASLLGKKLQDNLVSQGTGFHRGKEHIAVVEPVPSARW